MGRKTRRLVLCVVACSTIGIILGATASLAENNQCLTDETPSDSCLTKDPWLRTLEGMFGGLIAGTGAAVGATWQSWQKD